MRRLAILALLALSGCHSVWAVRGVDGYRLAECYSGPFTGFCVVNVTDHQAVVGSASGWVPGVGQGIGAVNNASVDAAILAHVP